MLQQTLSRPASQQAPTYLSRARVLGQWRCSGFSLIEVMITLAIVAILAAIAYPSYQEQVERGNLAECSAFAYSLVSQLERYYTQNLTYPASLSANTGLGLGSVASETGKCNASISKTGGTCAVGNADERCHGYTLSVTRTSSSSNLAKTCHTLTLSHRGEKGALDVDGAASAVETCWQ